MGLFDRFRRKEPDPEVDPLTDFVLAKMRVGYFVDYDLRTWTVTAHNRYRMNNGRQAEEWELSEGRDKLYLEHSVLGSDEGWSLSRVIPIGVLGSVREQILKNDEPPEITHDGTTYYLEGSVGGVLMPGDGSGEQEHIAWDFADEDEESFLSIQQWSETEVTAACGFYVEEYKFSNILPAADL